MISLHQAGSPAETMMAHALLEIISDPAKAKKHLDALTAEKLAAIEAMEKAREASAEAQKAHSAAAEKLTEAKWISDAFEANHEIRTKQLDERHEILVAKDKRLTDYEAQVAAREKELGEPLAAREKAIEDKEASLHERHAALEAMEAELAKVKQALDDRARKIMDAIK